MPEMSAIDAQEPTCEWWSMIYRSLRRSSGMLQHSEPALPGPGSLIALRASHTTPHTLNSAVHIVLAFSAASNRMCADVSVNTPPNTLRVKALKEKKLNAALETRGAMGQPVKLPAETWTKTNKSDFEK